MKTKTIILILILTLSYCAKKEDKNYWWLLGLVNTGTNAAGSSYSIAGTISGLTADGLVLQNNSADDLTVSANATSFTFATKVSGAYSVTVKTQPTNLSCTVSNESGSATANVTNVSVSCATSCATVTRNWGTFTDCSDGTVKLEVNAGSWGGDTYTAKTLYFAKCTHGQTYDSSGNTCTGTATPTQYCNATDNSCNGGTNTGTLDGGGTSEAYTACNGLSLAGKTWRVPTISELELLVNCNVTTELPNNGAGVSCSSFTAPTVNNLFPNTMPNYYWSSTSSNEYSNAQFAYYVYFNNGSRNNAVKTNKTFPLNFYLRCVAD